MIRLTIVLFFTTFLCFSQESTPTIGVKNELKVNAASLLAGFPEFTYERILSEDTAAGISVAFSIEDGVSLDYLITPYYRLYLGKKIASGFFLEGNGAVFSQELEVFEDGRITAEESRIGLGLGIAVGGKFILKENWSVEIYGGLGRNFIDNRTTDVYPRVGITLGRRF